MRAGTSPVGIVRAGELVGNEATEHGDCHLGYKRLNYGGDESQMERRTIGEAHALLPLSIMLLILILVRCQENPGQESSRQEGPREVSG